MSIWTDLMGHEVRQTFYDAGGVRTRAIEAGSGGRTLILLHGTGGHAEAYARNIVEHAKNFHVYALDMVGHGYSDMPEVAYHYDDYVNWLGAFLDTVGAGRVCLSGESLGAQVAQLFAIRHPDRVEKVVLNTGMMWPTNAEGRKELTDLLERSRAASGALTREAIRKRLEWLMYRPDKSVTEELIDVRYQIYMQPGRAAVIRKIAEASISGALALEAGKHYCDPEFLRRCRCPALVLWTRHNPGQSIPVAEAGMKHITNGRMVIMENSAHWPQWEESELFNRVHLEFLKSNG
ncbi:MAG: alpha/beta hydrolase [Candidatus Binataceae bacterium]|nr:alpha/beta hydrolase [Candidatus Binataceae bacterium]